MTTVNYESKAATEQQQKNEAAQEARNREVFFEVCCRFPIRDHDANFALLVQWAGDGILTIEKAEYLLKRRVSGFNPDVVTREQLIGELGQFLREMTSTKTLSDYDFKNWRFRAGTWSLRQLRAYKKELELKRQLQTVEQARNYLTEVRNEGVENKYVGYPRLLKTIVTPGQIFAVDTRQYLIDLAKSDIHAFKKYVRLYSEPQITNILNNR